MADVSEPVEDSGGRKAPARQRVLVDRHDEEPMIVHLAPWQRIEIRIVGPAYWGNNKEQDDLVIAPVPN